MVWTLRQPRYATLAAIMLVLALGCVGAGTFELHRFHEKRHDNGVLRSNAHSAPVPLTTGLVPLTGRGDAPGALAIRYCTVTVRGTFEAAGQQYLDDQSQGGRRGFLVLTPLRTAAGIVLVGRGFVAATADETRPAAIPGPPSGPVTLQGRLQTVSNGTDHAGQLPREEITAVNPSRQAARLGAPVFQTYLTSLRGQPGTAGLNALPAPDLSNPTGGAGELQLLSYVIQWYVFAVLALLAPFVFARADAKEARKRFLGLDDDDVEFDLAARAASSDAARPALPGGGADPGPDLSPMVRQRAELARAGAEAQWQRAERLADRYGRSLGPRPDPDAVRRAPVLREPAGPDSDVTPHRSGDTYHGSYNDYLWSLAMADGRIPEGTPDAPHASSTDRRGAPDETRTSPRVIDADPVDPPPDRPHTDGSGKGPGRGR